MTECESDIETITSITKKLIYPGDEIENFVSDFSNHRGSNNFMLKWKMPDL